MFKRRVSLNSQSSNVGWVISVGEEITPGTVKLEFVQASDPKNSKIVEDDGKGKLVPSVDTSRSFLKGGSVDYLLGVIRFMFGDVFEINEGDYFEFSFERVKVENRVFKERPHGLDPMFDSGSEYWNKKERNE